MGMAYTPPTADQVYQWLSRAERRAILAYGRTHKLRAPMRDRLETLGLLQRLWNGRWDWTALGGQVWYRVNEAETTKVVARINKAIQK